MKGALSWAGPLPAPFSPYGGKRRIAKLIASALPPHARYVEPFAGAWSVGFAKPPANVEVATDIDHEKITVLRFIRDNAPGLLADLRERPWVSERGHFNELRAQKPKAVVDVVYRFLYTRWSSFASRGDSYYDAGVLKIANWIKMVPEWSERLRDVTIYRQSWEKTVAEHARPQTVIYLDPPYLETDNDKAEHFEAPSAEALAAELRAAVKYGALCVLSNHDVPDLRREFRDWFFQDVSVTTEIDNVNPVSRRRRPEVLVSNFPMTLRGSSPRSR